MPEIFQDAQSAMGFVVSQTQNIETQVYQIRYPEFDYSAIVPVVTEGAAWASGTTFYTMDTVGTSEWVGDQANDAPYTDLVRGTGESSYYTRAGAYRYSLQEINQASMLGISLTAEKASGTRRVLEQFLYGLAVSGNSEKNMLGLINQSSVTAVDVPADGTGSSTFWPAKTPDLILRDVNAAIMAIRTATQTVETPDTLLLPDASYADIATRRLGAGDGAMTVLDFLRLKNVYTAMTGQPFNIRPLRDLAAADPGGDGRGVLFRNSRDVVRFHLPMPFQFLPIHQKNSFTWEQVGLVRTGGVEVRLPKAMYYMDSILDS